MCTIYLSLRFKAPTWKFHQSDMSLRFHQDERNYIMRVICESTQTNISKLSVASLQCLSKIMSLYYKHMENYMSQALFAITLSALDSKDDQVALEGWLHFRLTISNTTSITYPHLGKKFVLSFPWHLETNRC